MRSTSTISASPFAAAGLPTSVNALSRDSRSATSRASCSTFVRSDPVSVYWYCARAARVVIWMSWLARNTAEMPGTVVAACFSRSITASMLEARSSLGRKTMVRRPTFGAELTVPTPATETTPVTSGSFSTACARAVCRRTISAKDTVGSASSVAVTRPVS